MLEPIDIRTGKPFVSRRCHEHHPPSDGASLGGSWGRARGLMGGAFMGCMMAQQSSGPHTYDVQDYVGWGTSDLIAMWDGIRNVGATSPHDSSATTWADLTGNGNDMTLGDNGSFVGGNKFSSIGGYAATLSKSVAGVKSLEICFVATNTGGERGFLALQYAAVAQNQNQAYIWLRAGIGIGRDYAVPISAHMAYTASFVLVGQYNNICRVNGAVGEKSANYNYFSHVDRLGIGFRNYAYLGYIYSIRAYSRTITDVEAAANYAIDKARFNLP